MSQSQPRNFRMCLKMCIESWYMFYFECVWLQLYFCRTFTIYYLLVPIYKEWVAKPAFTCRKCQIILWRKCKNKLLKKPNERINQFLQSICSINLELLFVSTHVYTKQEAADYYAALFALKETHPSATKNKHATRNNSNLRDVYFVFLPKIRRDPIWKLTNYPQEKLVDRKHFLEGLHLFRVK